jgi:hypothetical protein
MTSPSASFDGTLHARLRYSRTRAASGACCTKGTLFGAPGAATLRSTVDLETGSPGVVAVTHKKACDLGAAPLEMHLRRFAECDDHAPR